VFLLSEEVVIKFYAPLWPDDWIREVELHGILAATPGLPFPGLIGSGVVPARTRGAGGRDWPYALFERLPGERLGDAWPRISTAAKARLAADLGRMVRTLHGADLSQIRSIPCQRKSWPAFIRRRVPGAAERHREWESLPAQLVPHVERFLGGPWLPPRRGWLTSLLSCDVTADHVLVREGRGESGGRWEISGFIDLGDAMVGDPEYDFLPVLISAVGGEPAAFLSFLAGYGYDGFTDGWLAHRLLAYALIHPFDVFLELPPNLRGILSAAETMEEAAQQLSLALS
jgi:hygromycin-B 7''-O-kinase